jgi:hypothetical protein
VNVTKQQLENLYIGQDLTLRQCADTLGLPTHGGISWRLKKFGISARPQLQTDKFNGGAKKRDIHKKSVPCSQCGVELFRFPSLINEKNFCNDTCYGKWRSENFKGEANPNFGNTAMNGAGNSNWKGGISYEPYPPIFVDKRFKAGIRERDNHECQNPDCRGEVNTLTCHHIDYDKKNCNPENLITLCVSCNCRANYNRDFWQAGYTEIIRLKYENQPEAIVN